LIPATTRVSDLGSATKEYNKLYAEDAALTGILTVTGTTTVSEYHQTQYQPADRPGSVDESMENVLHQRRSDFRNAERDRDEYSDGGCDHVFVDPATTRGAIWDRPPKSTTSSMPKTPP
jgi:hypothetical protein